MILVAVATRALVLTQAADSVYFANPVLDEQTNLATAQMWASGEGPERPLFKAPLYPWIVGQTLRVAPDEGAAITSVIVLQHIAGIIGAWIVWRIGWTLGGVFAGLFAGIAFAGAGALIFFEQSLLDASLSMTLLLGAIGLLVTGQGPIAPWRVLLTGLLLGAAIIMRPTCALPALVIMIWCLWPDGPKWRGLFASAIRTSLIAVPIAALIAIVAWGNGWQTPIATYGGPNLWLANNPSADGHSTRVPQIHGVPRMGEDYIERYALREAAARLGRDEVSRVEADRFWRGEALRFWQETPGKALLALGKRAVLFWQGPEIKNNRSLPFVGQQIPVLGWMMRLVSWLWLAPLGVVGLLLALHFHRPDRGRGVALVLITLIAIFAAGVPFPVNSRYRLLALPCLCLGSGLGVSALLSMAREKSWSGFTVAIGWFIGLVFVLHFDWSGQEPPGSWRDWWQLGNLAAERGDWDLAESSFEEALAQNPGHLESHVNLARIWIGQGKTTQALERLGVVLGLAPDYPVAWYLRGEALKISGDLPAAEEALRHALSLDPGHTSSARALMSLLFNAGRLSEAREIAERLAAQGSRDWEVWLALAWTREDAEGAREALDRAEELHPTLTAEQIPPPLRSRD
ncbi:tetratricopeptide repeat protein [Candidatus Sumerlaeota bacterium]|nr:tetratricopeptide repeat protein [Candidatus Sumerlaeota bacterium]